jgi:8-oxo-dGTP pyrophosphatase MutT (NUDIX family)
MKASELRSRLGQLRPTPSQTLVKSDRDLNPDWPLPARLKPAAVLVPLFIRDYVPYIGLTLRQPHLSEHAGQISFPGGRIDAGDADATAAALRETYEEVGIAPTLVEPLGWLDSYVTFTGYQVAPLVGLMSDIPNWQPSPGEVAEVIELPLEAVLAPEAFKIRRFTVPSGQVRQTYVLNYNGHDVWGATAAMLVNLRELLA